MKLIASTAATLFFGLLIPEDGIVVSSTSALVSNNLVLNFELTYNGKETTIYRFTDKSVGLSPNDCSRIILYDNELREINYAIFQCNLSSAYNGLSQNVKLSSGSKINFICQADTAEFRYSTKYNLPHYGVRFKNIRFYKMVYYAPINRPRNSLGKFESPLFSLQ